MPVRAALAALLLGAAAAPAPAAAEGGPLSVAELVAAELRPGWRLPEGSHMAALVITLAPGWKTYWRAPGEAGIPPAFDWTGSGNLAAVRLHWPAPAVFDQGGYRSIGYHDRLVLPLELLPRDRAAAIDLVAGVEIGVCRDICVPVGLRLAARLPAAGAPPDPAIAAALADRPLSAAEAGVTAHRCRIEAAPGGLRVTALVALPAAGRIEAAAFEIAAPPDGEAGLWVSEAELRALAGAVEASAEILPEGGGPLALDRSDLRLTLIAADGAVELTGCPPG